jgi:hypothetical protein
MYLCPDRSIDFAKVQEIAEDRKRIRLCVTERLFGFKKNEGLSRLRLHSLPFSAFLTYNPIVGAGTYRVSNHEHFVSASPKKPSLGRLRRIEVTEEQ